MLAPEAASSAWVEREIQRAEDGGKPIMPVLLGGTCLFRLTHLQHEDVLGGAMPGAAFFAVLRRLVGPAPDAVPPVDAPVETPGTETFEKVTVRLDRTPVYQQLSFRGSSVARVTVGHHRLVASGPKLDLEIDDVGRIAYGRFGTDIVTRWVKLDFRQGSERYRTLYLADAGYLGYRGILGGTRQLEQSLLRCFGQES